MVKGLVKLSDTKFARKWPSLHGHKGLEQVCTTACTHTQYTTFGSSGRICPDVHGLKMNRSEAGVRISNKCVPFSTSLNYMVLASLRNTDDSMTVGSVTMTM